MMKLYLLAFEALLAFVYVVALATSVQVRGKASAAPTVPGETDPGAAVVSTPVEAKTEVLKMSPEELSVASLPWEGMDQPARYKAGGFPRQNPWDIAADSTQHVPFGQSHLIPAHPPPFIPGDIDHTAEHKKLAKEEDEWMRTSRTPSLPAIGPAFYGHHLKPEHYYPNPYKGYMKNILKSNFLEISEQYNNRLNNKNSNSKNNMQPHLIHKSSSSSAYKVKRHLKSAYSKKRNVAANHIISLIETSERNLGTGIVNLLQVRNLEKLKNLKKINQYRMLNRNKYGPYNHNANRVQGTYAGGAHVGGESANSATYGVGVPAPGVQIAQRVGGIQNQYIPPPGGYNANSVVSNPNPQFVKPLIQQPVVQYVSNTRGGVGGHNEAYGGPIYQRPGTVMTAGGTMGMPPGSGANPTMPRFQQLRVNLNKVNMKEKGKGEAKNLGSPWFAPPVLGKYPGNPAVAVIGTDQSMLAAPSRQQFTGDFHPGNKPLPVRAYSDDHPSSYQAAPTWPPAPPEPLFPLKSHSHFYPAPSRPLPGRVAANPSLPPASMGAYRL
jgi:hypothetical protein